MKKIARLLAPLVSAGFAVSAGAAGITVPDVHRSLSASTRRLAVTPQVAQAIGVGLNLDVVGRITAGGTTFKTSVDIANNTTTDTQVDIYFSGTDLAHGTAIDIGPISVSAAGLVSQGADLLAHLSVFHSDDLIDDFRAAGLITQTEEDDGVLGSLFAIYNSPSAGLFDQIGQGSVQARFYSANADGTIGVSANGHELTETEPTSLVGIVRDTVGPPSEAGTPQVYTNFFINNEGFADTSGNIVANDVQVRLTGYSNHTGAKTGQTGLLSIGAFQTIGVSKVFDAVGGNHATDDTLIVFVDIVSGTSAISGLSSTNDAGTKDPSAAQLRPADWATGHP
jgi:hypothetical protein